MFSLRHAPLPPRRVVHAPSPSPGPQAASAGSTSTGVLPPAFPGFLLSSQAHDPRLFLGSTRWLSVLSQLLSFRGAPRARRQPEPGRDRRGPVVGPPGRAASQIPAQGTVPRHVQDRRRGPPRHPLRRAPFAAGPALPLPAPAPPRPAGARGSWGRRGAAHRREDGRAGGQRPETRARRRRSFLPRRRRGAAPGSDRRWRQREDRELPAAARPQSLRLPTEARRLVARRPPSWRPPARRLPFDTERPRREGGGGGGRARGCQGKGLTSRAVPQTSTLGPERQRGT